MTDKVKFKISFSSKKKENVQTEKKVEPNKKTEVLDVFKNKEEENPPELWKPTYLSINEYSAPTVIPFGSTLAHEDDSVNKYDELYDEEIKRERKKGIKGPIRLGFVEDQYKNDDDNETNVKSEEEDQESSNNLKRKPSRFLNSLLKTSYRRTIEKEIIEERKLKKERDTEKQLYTDKEVFVTSAYKKRLEEREQIRRELALQNLMDKKNDPKNQQNLSKFHTFLLESGKGSRLGQNESSTTSINPLENTNNAKKAKTETSKN